MENKEFTVIKPFQFWSQHVLPLVYGDELSYMEVQDKISYLLNELIKNNNQLPEFISNLIQEYITSGELEEVVRKVVANFILNVKYPPEGLTPAVGDGTQNDTVAVQGCIDYAASQGGGAVYFPYGKYLINSLQMKDNVALIGFDRYSTHIVMAGGNEMALIAGEASGVSLLNLTIDANMSVQVNDVDAINVQGQDWLLANLIVKDGYTLLTFIGTGGHLQINSVVLGKCVIQAGNISGDVLVQMNNTVFEQISPLEATEVLEVSSDNGEYHFVSNCKVPVCVVVSGNNNYFQGRIENALAPYTNTGMGNSFDFPGYTRALYYSGNDGLNLDGNQTLSIKGKQTINVDGDKKETILGATKHDYIGNRTDTDSDYTHVATGTISESSKSKNVLVQTELSETVGSHTENVSETFSLNADTAKITASTVIFSANKNLTASADNIAAVIGKSSVQIEGGTSTKMSGGNSTMEMDNNQVKTDTETVKFNSDTFNNDTSTYNLQTVNAVIDSANPVRYKEPVAGESDYFKTVPMLAMDGTPYNVLVATDKTWDLKKAGGGSIGTTRPKVCWYSGTATHVMADYFPMNGFRYMGRDFAPGGDILPLNQNFKAGNGMGGIVSHSNLKVSSSLIYQCWYGIFALRNGEGADLCIAPIYVVKSVNGNSLTLAASTENTNGGANAPGYQSDIIGNDVLLITESSLISGNVAKVVSFVGGTLTVDNALNLAPNDTILIAPSKPGNYGYIASHYIDTAEWRNRQDNGFMCKSYGVAITGDPIFGTSGFETNWKNCISPIGSGAIFYANYTYSSSATGDVYLNVGEDSPHRIEEARISKWKETSQAVSSPVIQCSYGYRHITNIETHADSSLGTPTSWQIRPIGWFEG